MLILSRRRGESIIIGNDIIVKIVDVSRETIKLGIKAPREISVHREEVFEMIKAENMEACRSISSYGEAVEKLSEWGGEPAFMKRASVVPSLIKNTGIGKSN